MGVKDAKDIEELSCGKQKRYFLALKEKKNFFVPGTNNRVFITASPPATPTNSSGGKKIEAGLGTTENPLLTEGNRTVPRPPIGSRVTVHYVGFFVHNGGGKKQFDSSRDRGKPFTFTLGAGEVPISPDRSCLSGHIGGKFRLR